MGWSELEGIANRTDYDLSAHSRGPKNPDAVGELRYYDQELKKHIVPYVIEPSAGADRATLAFLCDAYDESLVKEPPEAEVAKLREQEQAEILKKQTVDIGDRVKEGQLLVEIDDPEVVEEAKKAAADLELARSNVEQARARIKTAEAQRDAAAAAAKQAEADIRRYTAERVYQGKRLQRYRELAARNAVSQENVDEVRDQYEAAIAADAISVRQRDEGRFNRRLPANIAPEKRVFPAPLFNERYP